MKIDINNIKELPSLDDVRHVTTSRSGFDPVPVETLVGMYFESLEHLENYHKAVVNLHHALVNHGILGKKAPAPLPVTN